MEFAGEAPRQGIGLELIATYKLLRGALLLALSAALCFAQLRHGTPEGWARSLVDGLSDSHFEWAQLAGDWLSTRVSSSRVYAALGLLAADSLYTLVLGIGLHRGKRWAELLSLLSSAVPLPVELYHLALRPNLGLLAFSCVNAAIAGYLLRRGLRRSRLKPPAAPPAPAPGAPSR